MSQIFGIFIMLILLAILFTLCVVGGIVSTIYKNIRDGKKY